MRTDPRYPTSVEEDPLSNASGPETDPGRTMDHRKYMGKCMYMYVRMCIGGERAIAMRQFDVHCT